MIRGLQRACTSIPLALLVPLAASANWERGMEALREGDYETAARQLKPAARSGDYRAQYSLGMLYLQGQGVDADPKRAARLLRQSARAGFPPGQTALGTLYATGTGVGRDDEKAVRWYRKAAESGEVEGQAALGIMLRFGRGAEQDSVEAAVWLSLAEAQGSEPAAKHLAELREDLTAEQRSEVDDRVEALAEELEVEMPGGNRGATRSGAEPPAADGPP